jgi:hypothetical protein
MLADAAIVDLKQKLDCVVAALRINTEAGEQVVVQLPIEIMESRTEVK